LDRGGRFLPFSRSGIVKNDPVRAADLAAIPFPLEPYSGGTFLSYYSGEICELSFPPSHLVEYYPPQPTLFVPRSPFLVDRKRRPFAFSFIYSMDHEPVS